MMVVQIANNSFPLNYTCQALYDLGDMYLCYSRITSAYPVVDIGIYSGVPCFSDSSNTVNYGDTRYGNRRVCYKPDNRYNQLDYMSESQEFTANYISSFFIESSPDVYENYTFATRNEIIWKEDCPYNRESVNNWYYNINLITHAQLVVLGVDIFGILFFTMFYIFWEWQHIHVRDFLLFLVVLVVLVVHLVWVGVCVLVCVLVCVCVCWCVVCVCLLYYFILFTQ